MFEDIVKESYESLFETKFNKKENKNITFEKKKLEQNDITTRESLDFSMEDDDEAGDFESAADESSGINESSSSDEFGGGDDSSSDNDMNFDDSDFDDDSGEGGDDSFEDDESGSDDNGEDEGLNTLDNNKGSSLNPFTQINQKLYHIDRLNELLNSIRHSIDLYNVNYADWSEVDQLKELGTIVANEQKSFVMQQNPENLIKLGLYYEQYDKIVQNISLKISRLNSNNKN